MQLLSLWKSSKNIWQINNQDRSASFFSSFFIFSSLFLLSSLSSLGPPGPLLEVPGPPKGPGPLTQLWLLYPDCAPGPIRIIFFFLISSSDIQVSYPAITYKSAACNNLQICRLDEIHSPGPASSLLSPKSALKVGKEIPFYGTFIECKCQY